MRWKASGFLAVWVAGLSAGTMVRGHVDGEAFHLSEQMADILAALGFLMLGAGPAGPGALARDAAHGAVRGAEPDRDPAAAGRRRR